MRFRAVVAGAVLAAVVCGAGCRTSIRFPYLWPGTPGFGGNIDQAGVPEPSGICIHPSRKTLFVVSDDGLVFELTMQGALVSRTEVPGDLEGITVDPSTGLLYIVVEGEDIILEYDPVGRAVTRRFPVNRAYGRNKQFLQKQVDSYDNGLESLVFVPRARHREGGTFFAGNQWDPPCVLEILVPLKSSRAPEAEARILRVLPLKIDDPSGMYYDPVRKRLNIVCDADNVLVESTLQGRLVRSYAFPGDNQEGLCRDEEGYLYIAQDSGGIIKIKDVRRTP